jgi:tetratricopeptide (TPR) repeat protein
MQLPENRFGFSSKRDRRRRNKRITAVILLLLLGAGAAVFFIPGLSFPWAGTAEEEEAAADGPDERGQGEAAKEDGSLSGLWKRREYSEINSLCEEYLQEQPLDQKHLVYNGFAYFYRGVNQYTLEDQLTLFDKAVVNLRKTLVYEDPLLEDKVHYILGKAYYHKGRFYSDLAIRHLLRAVELGYTAGDTNRYLGLAYGRLDEYEKSVNYFLKAAEDSADPILFMTIGRTYYKMERNEEAIQHLQRAINAAESSTVKEKSRFLLGKIFLDQGMLKKAENQYERILSDNPKSADAHYYLGEVYAKQNNRVKARAEWRKVLDIDPSHHGALLKLYD